MESQVNLDSVRRALSEVLPGAVCKSARGEERIGSRQADYVLDVQYLSSEFRLAVEELPRSGSSSARLREKAEHARSFMRQAKKPVIPLIVAPYIAPRSQELLREVGVSYMDLSGNAFIQHEGIHVDRRGFRNLFREERRAGDPFSDKASLIPRVLIGSERSWGVRELADAAGVSPGYASKVLQRLDDLGYVARDESGVSLRNAASLLDDWVAAYKRRPRNREHVLKYFCRAKSSLEIMSRMASASARSAPKYALSGQAGGHLVAEYASFDAVDVYIDDIAAKSFFRESLQLKRVDKGENLRFRRPHYRESAFFGMREIDGLWVVSDLQLYLDLRDYPVRGEEQAQRIYDLRLRSLVDGQ